MSFRTPKGAVLDQGISAGDEWITVGRERIREVAAALKEQGFQSYVMMTCVDHLAAPVAHAAAERFELVYQLRNLEKHEEVRIRVFVPEADPVAPSLHDLFKPANWDERETWDLFGISFEGHPELTRILMPEDWVGHPLRRDHPVGGEPVDFSDDHERWQTAPRDA